MGKEQFIEMVPVKGGTFIMGCTDESEIQYFPDEIPARKITLSDFYIGKHPVTQEQWMKVMGSIPNQNKSDNNQPDDNADIEDIDELFGNGGKNKRLFVAAFKKLIKKINIMDSDTENPDQNKNPVVNVSWHDVQTFIKKLNRKTGKKYALATEAQWEFAAKGGTRTQGFKFSGSNDPAEVAWFSANCESFDPNDQTQFFHSKSFFKSKNVGQLKANELGIFDMSGNVSEWCQDWFGPYDPANVIDPSGHSKGSERVYRGGGFNSYPKNLRVTFRGCIEPSYAHASLGFRLVINNSEKK